jgi:hypothetical protein
MIPILTAAVIVLAVAVAANLLITFAMIRRLRASESAGRQDIDSFRPDLGSVVGEFEVATTTGDRLTQRDLADGSFLLAFLLPECGGCGRVVAELQPDVLNDRSVIVAVAGSAGDPPTVAMLQSIPDDLRVVLSPVGGSMSQAFHVATFPTIVEVVDGRVAGVRENLAGPLPLTVAA